MNCGKKGHWSKDCLAPRIQGGTSANKAKIEEVDQEVNVKIAGSVSSFSLHGLASNFSDMALWNTDTGATSHMTPLLTTNVPRWKPGVT